MRLVPASLPAATAPVRRSSSVDALGTAPELRILDLRRRMEDVTLAAAQAERLPTLSVRGGYFHYGTKRYDSFEDELAIGVDLKIPVFNGFKTSSAIDGASKAAEAARLRYDAMRDAKRLQVRELARRLVALQEQPALADAPRRLAGSGSAWPTSPAGAARHVLPGAGGARRRAARRQRRHRRPLRPRAAVGDPAARDRAPGGATHRRGERAALSGASPAIMSDRLRRWLLVVVPLALAVGVAAAVVSTRPRGRWCRGGGASRAAARAGGDQRQGRAGRRYRGAGPAGRAHRRHSRMPASAVEAGEEIVRFDDGPVASELATAESDRLAVDRGVARGARRGGAGAPARRPDATLFGRGP